MKERTELGAAYTVCQPKWGGLLLDVCMLKVRSIAHDKAAIRDLKFRHTVFEGQRHHRRFAACRGIPRKLEEQ